VLLSDNGRLVTDILMFSWAPRLILPASWRVSSSPPRRIGMTRIPYYSNSTVSTSLHFTFLHSCCQERLALTLICE